MAIRHEDENEPRYTEAEYLKACVAADVAEHEAAGLAELNSKQAREIEQLKKAIKGGASAYAKLKDDRDRWKALRYEALEDIQFWKREAAVRMCASAREQLMLTPGAGDAFAPTRDAREMLRWATRSAERAGRV